MLCLDTDVAIASLTVCGLVVIPAAYNERCYPVIGSPGLHFFCVVRPNETHERCSLKARSRVGPVYYVIPRLPRFLRLRSILTTCGEVLRIRNINNIPPLSITNNHYGDLRSTTKSSMLLRSLEVRKDLHSSHLVYSSEVRETFRTRPNA
jgi:hypothetical protein